MAYFPTPILIVSASTNRGELFRTYDALAAGAIDVLDKPRGDGRDGAWEQRLRSTVKLVSRIKVITHLRARLGGSVNRSAARPAGPAAPHGWSAGARRSSRSAARRARPGAVVQILRALPRDLPAAGAARASTSTSRSAGRSRSGSTRSSPSASATHATASRSAGRASDGVHGASRAAPRGRSAGCSASTAVRSATAAGRRSTCSSHALAARPRRRPRWAACSPAWVATGREGLLAMRRAGAAHDRAGRGDARWCSACRARPSCSAPRSASCRSGRSARR